VIAVKTQTVQCVGVHKKYPLGKTEVTALNGVSTDIASSVLTVLAGPSGSGKSTLLNLIGLIDCPSEGTIHINGTDMGSLMESARTTLRKDMIGFIFQQFHLIPVLTAYENVEYPLSLINISKKEKNERIEMLLHRVGMWEFRHHRPAQLSGGQQQRVSIARALVKRPAMVLADEPTANLDSHNGAVVIELLKELSHENDTACIIASHDPIVIGLGDRVILLHDGQIKEEK